MSVRSAIILLAALVAASLLCSAAAVFLRSRMPVTAPAHVETVTARGVLHSIDVARGSVMLQHQAIAAFGMPEMTMSFPVSDAKLLAGRSVGEQVAFTLQKQDHTMLVVDLRPLFAPQLP